MADKLRIDSKLSPKGEFLFCAVSGSGVVNEDKSTRKEEVREYKVKLETTEELAADFMDAVDDLVDAALSKGDEVVKLPYQTNEDYDGIPKGMVWIEAKCGTQFEDSKTGEMVEANISIFDSRGDKCTLPDGVGIGKGSTGKVFGNVGVWDNKDGVGATLWLTGVQIADFVEYNFEDAPEEMEGGFKGFDSKKSDLEKEESTNEDERPSRDRSERPSRDRSERPSRDRSERPSRDRSERPSRDRSNRSERPSRDRSNRSETFIKRH